MEFCNKWDGKEASLPAGYQGPAGVTAVKLIKSWEVLDAESDEGFATKKTAELKKGDVILGANPNNNSIARILQTYGSDAFRFTTATGDSLHPKDWFDKYQTNAFTLIAIRDKMLELKRG